MKITEKTGVKITIYEKKEGKTTSKNIDVAEVKPGMSVKVLTGQLWSVTGEAWDDEELDDFAIPCQSAKGKKISFTPPCLHYERRLQK